MLGKVCSQLPFEVMTSRETREEVRLTYRYLDLRNAKVRDHGPQIDEGHAAVVADVLDPSGHTDLLSDVPLSYLKRVVPRIIDCTRIIRPGCRKLCPGLFFVPKTDHGQKIRMKTPRGGTE